MKNLKAYPMYRVKYYPLYRSFVSAFRALYPEEKLDDITDYFMVMVGNREFETIYKYIVSGAIKTRTGKNVVILDD